MDKDNPPSQYGQSSKPTARALIIKIGENKSRLVLKLAEYKERLRKSEFIINPRDSSRMRDWDTIYKIAITEKLINEGEVKTLDVAKELRYLYGTISLEYFNNACDVIQDYITTGGKNTTGGAGSSET